MTSRQAPVIYVLTTEDRAGFSEQTYHLTEAGALAARRHELIVELVERAIDATDGQAPRAELLQLEAETLALDEAAFVARAKEAGLTFYILDHLLYDWPAEQVWPGHTVTIQPKGAANVD